MDPWLWTWRPALWCPPTERGAARRGKRFWFFFLFFFWEVFSLAPLRHPPVHTHPPRRLSILLWSLCPPFTVFRGCAPVFSRPPQLICGSRSDTAQPERTLVGRSSPDRRLIRSTPPPFPTPLTPFSFFFSSTPPPPTPPPPPLSHHSHHRKHKRIRALMA